MTEPHFIEWRIENCFEPHAIFTCTAPEGASCRSWCTEPACEESCPGPILWGPVELVAQAPVEGHVWGPLEYCRVVTFLENGGTPGELYMGEDTVVRSGPIETEWDGDGYLWQYALPADGADGAS